MRRFVYTTNAIESVHSRLRKIIKTRGHFPSDDAANKLIWLALRNITADWGRAAKERREAMNQLTTMAFLRKLAPEDRPMRFAGSPAPLGRDSYRATPHASNCSQ